MVARNGFSQVIDSPYGRPFHLLNWAASSPSAGRLPSFPCLAGYLKPAFEPTKPSQPHRHCAISPTPRKPQLQTELTYRRRFDSIAIYCSMRSLHRHPHLSKPSKKKENQLKEERAPFPLLSLTKPPPVHSSTTDAENPIPSHPGFSLIPSLTC